MPTEESLIATRQSKHQEANGATYPLAQSGTVISDLIAYCDLHTVDSVDPLPVSVDPNESMFTWVLHGRITAFRKSGALAFIKVTDTTGSIQLIGTKMHLDTYADLRVLDLGDIIEVTGKLAWSKTGERSVLITSWKLLTKAVRPPPEKFVALQDTEMKYRQRYLDLMSSEESRARFIIRTYVVRAIRHIMDEQDFLEVETSTLSSIASGANAKPFTTIAKALGTELRLRIAPELNLKRLLVGGLDRVYEVGRAYRNEGIDTRHNPEFTIMESYEAYGNFPKLVSDTQLILRNVDHYLQQHLPSNIRSFYEQWKSERNFTFDSFATISMFDAMTVALTKADLLVSDNLSLIYMGDISNPRLQKIKMPELFEALNACSTVGDKVAVLFEHVAEPFLTDDYRTEDGSLSVPVFIIQHPKEISPLARSSDSDPSITDRFELYVDGRELANAFQELNDPKEQALRFQEQLAHNNKDPMAYDADYVRALEHGMPPAVGFGMGIDRLVMLLTGTSSIKDVILFPALRPTSNHE